MKKTRARTWAGRVAFAATVYIFASTIPGCGSSGLEETCDIACDCAGDLCSSGALDACRDVADAIEERAAELGCLNEFNAAINCVNDAITCRGRSIDINPSLVTQCFDEAAAVPEACVKLFEDDFST